MGFNLQKFIGQLVHSDSSLGTIWASPQNIEQIITFYNFYNLGMLLRLIHKWLEDFIFHCGSQQVQDEIDTYSGNVYFLPLSLSQHLWADGLWSAVPYNTTWGQMSHDAAKEAQQHCACCSILKLLALQSHATAS
jgi:hypothetical protein